MTAGAMREGWSVDRAAFIAPPLADGDRWMRYAEKLGVTEDVALAAKAAYYAIHGTARADWQVRMVYPALDVDMLVVQSHDDERNSVDDAEATIRSIPVPASSSSTDSHTGARRRDPDVVSLVADFVTA
jgi:hypothetical protein